MSDRDTGQVVVPPGTGRAMMLIARRAMLEALRDRMTVVVSGAFAIGLPVLFLLTGVRSAAAEVESETGLGIVLGVFLLIVAVPPTTAAIGVAAGQFAGELERGILAPLLATPASNLAIFAGKVLGSVVPALIFSVLAELTYLAGAAAMLGPAALGQIPPWLGLGMLAFVPVVAVFAAGVASLISSRVRTYNSAQQLANLALLPLWGLLFGFAFRLVVAGTWALAAVIVALLAVDVGLILLAARSWRREQVLAQQ
jgi:ABC-type transport system involved in multi-copper enzyme maturation permease subunit